MKFPFDFSLSLVFRLVFSGMVLAVALWPVIATLMKMGGIDHDPKLVIPIQHAGLYQGISQGRVVGIRSSFRGTSAPVFVYRPRCDRAGRPSPRSISHFISRLKSRFISRSNFEAKVPVRKRQCYRPRHSLEGGRGSCRCRGPSARRFRTVKPARLRRALSASLRSGALTVRPRLG